MEEVEELRPRRRRELKERDSRGMCMCMYMCILEEGGGVCENCSVGAVCFFVCFFFLWRERVVDDVNTGYQS